MKAEIAQYAEIAAAHAVGDIEALYDQRVGSHALTAF
jgi:hypothetical protein